MRPMNLKMRAHYCSDTKQNEFYLHMQCASSILGIDSSFFFCACPVVVFLNCILKVGDVLLYSVSNAVKSLSNSDSRADNTQVVNPTASFT